MSNIVLNELDWWIHSQWEGVKLKKDYSKIGIRNGRTDLSNKYRAMKTTKLKEVRIVRYADDFKIMCRNKQDANKIFEAVKQWLNERLKLEISPEKSKITNLKKNKSEFLGFEFKLVDKKNKKIIQSKMTEKAKKKCIRNIRRRIKFLKSQASIYNIAKFNSTVLGMQNYYQIATNCTRDFSYIDYITRKSIENQLKGIYTLKGKKNRTFQKIYGNYNGKTYYIKDIALFPIYAIKHKNPMNLRNNLCDYTDEGRKLIHESVKGLDIRIVRYMVANPITNRSVEYNDNRISLYYGQKGLCGVTGEYLKIGEMECHHKVPVENGGDDKYKNLIFVTRAVHKLIHATNKETIVKYFKKIKIDEKGFKKLNVLRKKVGNSELNLLDIN